MDTKHRLAGDVVTGLVAAIALHAILIFMAFAWVAIYSHGIDPGHDQAFYEAYAMRSSPVVSTVAGGPVFFLVARWLTRRRGNGRAAWIGTAIYMASEIILLVAVGAIASWLALVALAGGLLKIAGTALGVRRALA
ncbi:MAG TPA: hypothetical protein VGB54_07600 [Allosphingosinicella sp.]|jgi:hypothetical protein